MSSTYVNTPFVISLSGVDYKPDEIWVTFAGTFTYTGVAQTIGTRLVNYKKNWQSYPLTELTASVPRLPFFGQASPYTFSLNRFSGRIYINYGSKALAAAPTPGNPGPSPYLVFELTVNGETLPGGAVSQSNMDLSYVDGVSAPAATMIQNATTGAALPATSVNPVETKPDIMANVAKLVPAGAGVRDTEKNIMRIMSSAAAPSAYHDWSKLMTMLQTAGTSLDISSYRSPQLAALDRDALNNALFGYSGAPKTKSHQAANFENKQNYKATATFMADLNSDGDAALTKLGIAKGTAGVVISGAGIKVEKLSPAGSFSIYITEADLNIGTGIYGENPCYVVAPKGGTAYKTKGIVNDLGGRIVGDLMAGMGFGWAASTINIIAHAKTTNTKLLGVTFSSKTVGGLSSGELFFLLSLAGAQRTLPKWIGPALDSQEDHYDPYLYAIAANSDAYGSGFTDRLQGYINPDTYWYTANPPAIPGGKGNFDVVGFVGIELGCKTGRTSD